MCFPFERKPQTPYRKIMAGNISRPYCAPLRNRDTHMPCGGLYNWTGGQAGQGFATSRVNESSLVLTLGSPRARALRRRWLLPARQCRRRKTNSTATSATHITNQRQEKQLMTTFVSVCTGRARPKRQTQACRGALSQQYQQQQQK